MTARHHYVSQFHLRSFTDPTARATDEPWLWVGDCNGGSIKRRAPKNLAWSTGMFQGRGGLSKTSTSLETYLASQVEGVGDHE